MIQIVVAKLFQLSKKVAKFLIQIFVMKLNLKMIKNIVLSHQMNAKNFIKIALLLQMRMNATQISQKILSDLNALIKMESVTMNQLINVKLS